MPKSRNSRSKSPLKPLTAAELSTLSEREQIYQNVQEMFKEAVDSDVIHLVLTECDWRGEEATEKLLDIVDSSEIRRQYMKKSQLQQIAEGVFGSLRSDEYPIYGSQHSASSSLQGSPLSQKDKVIQRPNKSTGHRPAQVETGKQDSELQGTTQLHIPIRNLSARGSDSYDNKQDQDSFVDDIELDLHFPRLPLRKPASSRSSGSSPIGSHRPYSGQQQSGSQPDLISEAQTAYQQQFDDAAGAQRWEQYKSKLSEHYAKSMVGIRSSDNYKNTAGAVPNSSNVTSSVPGDPAISQAQKERTKTETSRSFPVRLLSRSPDEDSVEVPEGNVQESKEYGRLDSADLDETVLKCIYEVHDDLLDQAVFADRAMRKRNSSGKISDLDSERLSAGTPEGSGHATPTPSNQPMTLPVIGLSANAAEFVPRPKATKPEKREPSKETTKKEPLKSVKSKSIEIKAGAKNIRMNSPTVQVASASSLTPSPVNSPVVSPPGSNTGSPATNLTGSPMFITPKWQPMFPGIPTPPPPIRPPVSIIPTSGTRFIAPPPPHHLPPPQYRVPVSHIPFSTRMVYPMAQSPPVFHVAGVSPHIQPLQQPLSSMEERAMIATGQPIMATAEIGRHMPPTPLTSIPGLPVKLVNQVAVEHNVQRIREIHQTGRKVMVLIRGLPGSGKTTLSRALKQDGVVLSTDDYFMKGDVYEYNPEKLAESHQWNRERAKEAMKMGTSPVIIDNTNTQKWEFKPYVSMAHNNSYHVEIMEPDTPWKSNPKELARRTVHGVPKDQIQRMLQRYERNITVEMVTTKKKNVAQTSKESVSRMSSLEEDKSREKETATKAGPAKVADKKDKAKVADKKGKAKDITTGAVKVESEGVDDWDMNPEAAATWFDSPRNSVSQASSFDKDSDVSPESNSSNRLSNSGNRTSLNWDSGVQGKGQGSSPTVSKRPGLHGLNSRARSIEKTEVPPQVVHEPAKEVRKTLQDVNIDACLSEETVQVVDDMVSEHVNDKSLSSNDLSRVEAELKALLQLYPIDDKERKAAEKLIGQKLHGNPVDEIDDADIFHVHELVDEIVYVDNDVQEKLKQNIDVFETLDSCSSGLEAVAGMKKKEINKKSQPHSETQGHAQSVNQIVHGKCSTEPSVPNLSVETENSSQGDIYVDIVQSTLNDSEGISNSDNNENNVIQNVNNITSPSDVELQYWNKNTASAETLETNEHVEAVWDNTETVQSSWTGEILTNQDTSRPQRIRKVRHNSSTTDRKENAEIDMHDTEEKSKDLNKDDGDEHERDGDLKQDHEKSDSSNQISEGQSSEDFHSCVENSLNSSNNSALDDLQESVSYDKSDAHVHDIEVEDKSVDDIFQYVIETGIDHSAELIPNSTEAIYKLDRITERESENLEGFDEQLDTLVDNCVTVTDGLATEQLGNSVDIDLTEGNKPDVEEVTESVSVTNVNVCEPCLTVRENSSLSLLKDSYSDSGTHNETFAVGSQEIYIDDCPNDTHLDTGELSNHVQNTECSDDKEPSLSSTVTQNSNIETALEEANQDQVNASIKSTTDVAFPKTGKRKKDLRKKMAANLPFFEEKDKESFLSADWGTFPITSDHLNIQQETTHPHSITNNISNKIHQETMTLEEDFTILNTLCNGGFIDSSVRYITSKGRRLIIPDNETINTNNSDRNIAEKFTIHQSTSTHDLNVEDSKSIAFLKTCFPEAKAGELECVLANCDNNVEWAIEMLLEWEYSSDLTEEETEDFVKRLENVNKMAGANNVDTETLNDVKQPKLLRDICFEFTVQKKIASTEELELQLIQTGKERLSRIEDENLTKIRLWRSSSMSETSPRGHYKQLDVTPSTVLRSLSAPEGGKIGDKKNILNKDNDTNRLSKTKLNDIEIKEFNSHQEDSAVKENTESNELSSKINIPETLHELSSARLNDSETGIADLIEINNVPEPKIETSTPKKKQKQVVEGIENDLELDVEEDRFEGTASGLTMDLDGGLVKQLEKVFGPMGYHGSDMGRVNVRVDHQTAWNLYQCVKMSMAETSKNIKQQLAEDERLARLLQEEENSLDTRERGGSPGRAPRAPALVGVSGAGVRIPARERPVIQSKPVKSLVEIMEEETRIQTKQDQFKNLLHHQGGYKVLATRMKRQKLYEMYPSLDRTMLDEVFQNFCFNLEETVEHIETHTGESALRMDTPDTGMTEEEMIEATKRQSIQDTLDSYLYTPFVSKDYQDGADPVYEDYRGEANLHHRLRHECFQKAQEAYRRGLSQVAAFYSQQGHLHTKKIKEANMRASELILEERNSELEKNQTLDLHGLHVDEAIAALNRILPQKQREQRKGQLTIVTGRGSHSKGGVARLRPSVLAYLKQQQYSFTENQPGVIKVALRSRKQDR